MKDYLKKLKSQDSKTTKIDPVQDLFENVLESVSRLDTNGAFLSVNPNFAEAYGYQAEEMVGMSYKDTVFPDDVVLIEDAYIDMLKKGRSEIEVRGIRKNTSVFYQHIVLVKGLAGDKSAIGHYCFMQDITSRALKQHVLAKTDRETSDMLPSLINNIQGAVYRCSVKDNWHFDYLDKKVAEILGLSLPEVPKDGRALFFKYTHREDVRKIFKILKKDIPENGKYEFEYRVICQDGSTKWLQNSATCVLDDEHQLIYLDGVIFDITKRKQTELALQESELKFTTAFDTSPTVMCLTQVEGGNILAVNRSFEEAFGYGREEILGESSIGLWSTPEDRKKLLEALAETGRCNDYECEFKHKDGHIGSALISANIIDIDGKPCVFAAGHDITERIRTETELLASKQKYASSINLSPDAIYQTRLSDGLILDVNIGFTRTTGFSKEEVIGKTTTELNLWPDIKDREEYLRLLKKSGEVHELEIRYQKKNGELSVAVISSVIVDSQGEQLLFTIARDISESIKAERQLRASEERFSAAINASPDAIVITRLSDGTIQDFNQAALKLTGYTREELLGKTTVEMDFYNDEERKTFTDLLQKDGKFADKDFHLKRKDGAIVYTLSSAVILNLQGELCIFSIIHDVTQRKKEELALKESQAMLSGAFESTPDAITISRLGDGVFLSVNSSFTNISGFSQEDVIGKSALDIGLWINEKDRTNFISRLKQDGHCADLEFEIRTKSGKVINTLITGSIIHVDGEPSLFAITRDITQQKKEEENLLQIAKGVSSKTGEQFFTSLVEHLAHSLEVDFAFVANVDPENTNHVTTIAMFASGEHVENIEYNLVGTPCETVITNDQESKIFTNNVQNLFPDDELLKEMGAKSYAGAGLIDSSNVEMGLIAVVGKKSFRKPERISSTLQIFAARAAAELERMRSHQKLVTSEENFRRAIASSPDCITIVTLDGGKIIDVNDGFCQISGYSKEEVIGQSIINYWLYPEERDGFIKIIQQQGSIKNLQHTFLGKGGKEIDGSVSSVIIEYQGLTCIFSVTHDITHIKDAERALSASEEKFRSAFGNAPVGVALVDENAKVIQANKIVTDALGYDENDLIGKTIADITHSEDIDKSLSQFARLIAGEINSYDFEKCYQSKSGERVWSQINVASVRDENDKFQFAIVHIVDISERKQSAEQLDRTNRALRVLNECNVAIRQVSNEESLLQNICRVIINTGGYHFAWVGYAREDKQKTVSPMASAGYEEGYLKQTILWSDKPRGRGPTGTCIRTGSPQVCTNTNNDPNFKPWHKAALERNYHSLVALPLNIDGKTIGGLMIYSSETEVFDSEEVKLLSNLAENMAFGIQSLRLKEESQVAALILLNSEEKFRETFGNAPVGMVIVNSDGVLMEANQAAFKMSGLSEREFVGRNITDITHPDDIKNSMKYFKELWAGEFDSYQIDKRYLHKDGHIIYCILHGSLVRDKDNNPLFMVGQIEDVTDKKHFTDALATSEAKFKMLYHDTPAMFFDVDKAGTILSVNDYGADQLGYSVEELLGTEVVSIFHKDDKKALKEYLAQCYQEPQRVHKWELRKHHKNGHTIWVRETARLVSKQDGTQSLFVVCEDITETYRLSKQLSYQASHDSLTGLVNRAEFERRLERVIEANRSTESSHALCYLDLDQFKIINDTCGHLAGDELLRQLSELLLARVRKRDTLARLGGDEFGVLMEHCDLNQARRVADSLRETVEDFRFVWQDKKFSIGVSIGLVPISESSGNVNDILSAADAACYAAKDAGRNRIHVYSSDDKTMAQRRGEMQWVHRIDHALEEGLFRLYYQKIVPIKNKAKGDHYELLLRMLGDNRELIPPGAFLPAAERYGLSTRIDQWVVNKALSWLVEHPKKLKQLHICAINLSGQTLGNDEFMENLLIRLDESQVPPEKLCFEITETSAIANLASAIRFINKFRVKGCLFALDDFGSGVSSFGYLKNLPVDYLKIDGGFVRDIMTDKTDRAMVKSINEIGHIMGKKTIAEFVENETILKELKKLGVDYAQGYGIGKPRALYNVRKGKK